MGFWDTISDLVDAATPWSVADAEAPPAEEKSEDSKVGDALDTVGGPHNFRLREEPWPLKRRSLSFECGQAVRATFQSNDS